jgi:hypothetical protein
MPITYRIDQERGRIFTTCTGYVTLPQVMAHFDALQRDPDCPPRLDVLLDLTEATSLPETPQMRAVAERVGLVQDIVFGACAIVATRDSLFGMARMFEVFARGHFASIRTFRDRKEAEQWLGAF